jgi:hypothetical protein
MLSKLVVASKMGKSTDEAVRRKNGILVKFVPAPNKHLPIEKLQYHIP